MISSPGTVMDESVSAQLTIWSVLSVIKDVCREVLKALLVWLLDENEHGRNRSNNMVTEGNKMLTGVCFLIQLKSVCQFLK